MGADVSNLLSGPGVLYRAPFGNAAEPVDTAVGSPPSAVVWTDVGGTMDGVTITINQEFFEIEIDQTVDVAGRRLTKRDIQLSTNLAEATLENLAFMTNAGANVTTGAGFKSLEPGNDAAATQLTYSALLFDGYAPGDGKTRRVIARRMLSTDNVELAYKKGDLTVLTATFSAHFVSNSIAPYRIIDET